MAKLNKAEKEELEQLRAEQGPLQSSLSPEEKEELEALRTEQGPLTSEPSELEAAGRGALQGATLGYSDEIIGAAESAFSNKSYEQARDESRKANELAREAHGGFYLGGEVAGGVGMSLASGGTFAGMRGAAVLGGLTGVGMSNRTGADLALDGAVGTALGAGSEVVMKGIGKFTKNLFNNSSDETKKVFEEMGLTSRPENVQFETSLLKAAWEGKYGSADMLLGSDEALMIANQQMDVLPQLIQDEISDQLRNLGAKQKVLVSTLGDSKINLFKDIQLPDGRVMPSPVQALQENLKQFINVGPEGKAADFVKKNILDKISNGSVMIGDDVLDFNNLSFSQGQKVKRWINSITQQNANPGALTDEAKIFANASGVDGVLKKFAGDVLEVQNSIGGEDLRFINNQFSNLLDAKDMAPKTFPDLLGLTKKIGESGKIQQGRLFLQSLEAFNPEFRNKLVTELNAPISLWKMVNSVSNAKDLGLPEFFRGRAAASALGPVGYVVGAAMGDQGAQLRIAQGLQRSGITEAMRKAAVIPRSIAGLMQNPDLVVSKVSMFSPALSVALNDAVADGDQNKVQEVMTKIFQIPEAKGSFEPGVGFEGMVTSPEEAAQLRNQVMSQQIPIREKMRMVEELDKAGKVPVFQPRPPVLGVKKQKLNLMGHSRQVVEKAEKDL